MVYDNALKQCLGLVNPELARNEEERNSVAKKVFVFCLKGLSGEMETNHLRIFWPEHRPSGAVEVLVGVDKKCMVLRTIREVVQ